MCRAQYNQDLRSIDLDNTSTSIVYVGHPGNMEAYVKKTRTNIDGSKTVWLIPTKPRTGDYPDNHNNHQWLNGKPSERSNLMYGNPYSYNTQPLLDGLKTATNDIVNGLTGDNDVSKLTNGKDDSYDLPLKTRMKLFEFRIRLFEKMMSSLNDTRDKGFSYSSKKTKQLEQKKTENVKKQKNAVQELYNVLRASPYVGDWFPSSFSAFEKMMANQQQRKGIYYSLKINIHVTGMPDTYTEFNKWWRKNRPEKAAN